MSKFKAPGAVVALIECANGSKLEITEGSRTFVKAASEDLLMFIFETVVTLPAAEGDDGETVPAEDVSAFLIQYVAAELESGEVTDETLVMPSADFIDLLEDLPEKVEGFSLDFAEAVLTVDGEPIDVDRAEDGVPELPNMDKGMELKELDAIWYPIDKEQGWAYLYAPVASEDGESLALDGEGEASTYVLVNIKASAWDMLAARFEADPRSDHVAGLEQVLEANPNLIVLPGPVPPEPTKSTGRRRLPKQDAPPVPPEEDLPESGSKEDPTEPPRAATNEAGEEPEPDSDASEESDDGDAEDADDTSPFPTLCVTEQEKADLEEKGQANRNAIGQDRLSKVDEVTGIEGVTHRAAIARESGRLLVLHLNLLGTEEPEGEPKFSERKKEIGCKALDKVPLDYLVFYRIRKYYKVVDVLEAVLESEAAEKPDVPTSKSLSAESMVLDQNSLAGAYPQLRSLMRAANAVILETIGQEYVDGGDDGPSFTLIQVVPAALYTEGPGALWVIETADNGQIGLLKTVPIAEHQPEEDEDVYCFEYAGELFFFDLTATTELMDVPAMPAAEKKEVRQSPHIQQQLDQLAALASSEPQGHNALDELDDSMVAALQKIAAGNLMVQEGYNMLVRLRAEGKLFCSKDPVTLEDVMALLTAGQQ